LSIAPQSSGQPDHGKASFDVVGSRVALGPLRRDLMDTYQEWRKGFGRLRDLDDALDPTEESDEEAEFWYDELVTTDEHAWFTVYELESARPIGITGLIDIDSSERSAEFFLHIGEVASQGSDYGAEAGRLMRDYAFTALGLESLFLMTYEFNMSELRSCERAGFREFGRQRRAHLMGGRLWDVIYLECQADDYPNPPFGNGFLPQQRYH
jgi:RimJ/RimL family protein N-acetyltransferase